MAAMRPDSLGVDEVCMLTICREIAWGTVEIQKQNGEIVVVKQTKTHNLKK